MYLPELKSPLPSLLFCSLFRPLSSSSRPPSLPPFLPNFPSRRAYPHFLSSLLCTEVRLCRSCPSSFLCDFCEDLHQRGHEKSWATDAAKARAAAKRAADRAIIMATKAYKARQDAVHNDVYVTLSALAPMPQTAGKPLSRYALIASFFLCVCVRVPNLLTPSSNGTASGIVLRC
jgi:hypothetical protein